MVTREVRIEILSPPGTPDLMVTWGSGTISGDPAWVARQIGLQVTAWLRDASMRPPGSTQD